MVVHAWIAFNYFMRAMGFSVADEALSTVIDGDCLRGVHYSYNRKPTTSCVIPGYITDLGSLCNYLRKKSYMAKRGTPPYKHIATAIRRLNVHINTMAAEAKQALEDVREDLRRVQAKGWRRVNIEGESPK